MFRRYPALSTAILVTSIALGAYAGKGKFKKVGGGEKATCDVDVPGFSFVGNVPASAVKASDDGESITVTVDLSNLDTHIAKRTRDLQEQLKSKTATMVAKKADLKVPDGNGSASGNAKGKLTINGVPVSDHPFTYKATRQGSHILVEGKSTVSLKAHGLEFCAPGKIVCVKDKMPITVNFKLADE